MKIAFVTGWPVSHSKSPLLHGYWLAHYGIEGRYVAHEVSPDDFAEFLNSFASEGFCGGNVTIPHKETAFARIKNLDAAAKQIGAVNTVWMENGELYGSNTDAYGFAANLDDHAKTWRGGKTALVLGAGGASRAIIHALKEAGYDHIRIANRTIARAEALAKEFGPQCSFHGLDELQQLSSSADLLVNTTSLGMSGSGGLDLKFVDALPDHAIVTDIVYTPLETPLLQKASSRALVTVDGLGMLLHQAVPGFEKWFGQRPEVTAQLRNHILESA